MSPVKVSWVFAACLGLLSACENRTSNSNPADNVAESTKEKDLQGKLFKSDCSLQPLDNVAAGIPTDGSYAIRGARMQYGFAGANLTKDTFLYKSSDCSGAASISYVETGQFRLDPKTTTADGGKSIDMDFDRLHVVVTDDVGMLIAKGLSLCGTNDWLIGTDRDVTDSAADPKCYKKKLPSHDANIYRFDAGNLYFGLKDPNTRSPDRPTALDRNIKYSE